MTTANKVSEKLRLFMAENHFDHSDIYRGMIAIINPEKGNGTGRGEARKSLRNDPRASDATTRMVIEDAESCFT